MCKTPQVVNLKNDYELLKMYTLSMENEMAAGEFGHAQNYG